jgi:cathepsin B
MPRVSKALSIALVSGAAAQQMPTGKTLINDPEVIQTYNSANDATWVAGVNDFFAGMTFDDARPILGTALSHVSDHLNNTLPQSHYDVLSDPPTEFDARTQWAGLVHPIMNQLQCGSCWAFSAAEVLSDRVAIATKKASPPLSPEDLVSCDKNDMGCQGGRLSSAWSYLKNTGIVTDKCFPYSAGGGKAPACATKCVDGESFTRQKASSAYAINGVTNMQKDISTNGPIQVAFSVYKSFMSYKSGVYTKHFWELLPEGGHAVKIVGWGTDSGTDYWLVANSWGTTWGLDGFFKIKRGTNACGIEQSGPPYAGLPATDSSSAKAADNDDVQGGTLKLVWKDCGDSSYHAKVTNVVPDTLAIGAKTTVTGSGNIDESVTGGSFTISAKFGPVSEHYDGEVCSPKTFKLPLGVGTVTWDGIKCPLAKGAVSVGVDVQLSSLIPASLAKGTIEVKATGASKDNLICLDLDVSKAAGMVVV